MSVAILEISLEILPLRRQINLLGPGQEDCSPLLWDQVASEKPFRRQSFPSSRL
jgi:hypothetical protein